jgi:peptidoglycan/LPS O-acetylase OafA/YrhL
MNLGSYQLIVLDTKGALPFPIQLGLCYFKDCDTKYLYQAKSDLVSFLNNLFSQNFTGDNIYFVNPTEETDKLKTNYSTGFYVVISLFSFLIVISIGSCIIPNSQKSVETTTVKVEAKGLIENENMEANENPKKSRPKNKLSFLKVLSFFNFFKNMKKILTIEPEGKDEARDKLKVFDGVRTFSIGWVVFGHAFVNSLLSALKNFPDFMDILKSWKFCFVYAGFYAVDVFFMLAGFVFCYGFQKYLKKGYLKSYNMKLKIFLVGVINRYIRLLPMYLVILFFMTYVMPYTGNGPTFFFNITKLNKDCEDKWYYNLLYINNFKSTSCAGHSWYLANDFQFFLYSMIIYLIFSDKAIIRNIIFLLTFLSHLIVSFYISYVNEYDNQIVSPKQADFFINYYIKPWTRIGPYLIGIFFAELFLSIPQTKEAENDKENQSILTKINITLINNKILPWILLVVSLAVINYSVFIYYYIYNSTTPISVFTNSFFNTFNKIFFVVALGILLHLLYLGHFKLIKSILSFPLFSPIAKVSYGIYLLHYYLQFSYFSSLGYSIYVRFYDLFFLSIGFFTWSLICSFIFSVLVESPIINLTKMLIG